MVAEITEALPELRNGFACGPDEVGLCQTPQLEAAMCWNHARSAATKTDLLSLRAEALLELAMVLAASSGARISEKGVIDAIQRGSADRT
jgi:hypothetical protein